MKPAVKRIIPTTAGVAIGMLMIYISTWNLGLALLSGTTTLVTVEFVDAMIYGSE